MFCSPVGMLAHPVRHEQLPSYRFHGNQRHGLRVGEQCGGQVFRLARVGLAQLLAELALMIECHVNIICDGVGTLTFVLNGWRAY